MAYLASPERRCSYRTSIAQQSVRRSDKIIPSVGTIEKYLPLSLQTSSISVVIGALFIHGLNLGSMLMIDQPGMFWFIVGALFTANIFMLGFGVFGYFMRHYGYPLGPVILGVILSRLLDDNWRRAIISEREDLGRLFLRASSQAPSLLGLFIAVILIFVSPTPVWTGIKTRLFGKAL